MCLKPRFMHEYAIKSFFMHFVTLEALKLGRNEIFLLSHSIPSAVLYIIKMRGYEPIITFNIQKGNIEFLMMELFFDRNIKMYYLANIMMI